MCNCGKKTGPKPTYLAKFGDGTTKTYSTEIEAQTAVSRKGGSYRVQKGK